MSKYFNTEILRLLLAQATANAPDLNGDPSKTKVEPAGRYLLYVSSDPNKQLDPGDVKRTLRNLFCDECTPQRCEVKIVSARMQREQERKEQERKEQEKKDQRLKEREKKKAMQKDPELKEREKKKATKDPEQKEREKKDLKQKNPKQKNPKLEISKENDPMQKYPKERNPKQKDLKQKDPEQKPNNKPEQTNLDGAVNESTPVMEVKMGSPSNEERSRGGLNVTFDPNALLHRPQESLVFLHRNLKPVCSSRTSQDGHYNRADGSFTEMGAPMLSEEELKVRLEEVLRRRDELMSCVREWGYLPRSQESRVMEEDEEEETTEEDEDPIMWIYRKALESGYLMHRRRIPEADDSGPSTLEQICQAIISFFRSIRNMLMPREPDTPPRSAELYVDPDHTGPLILGPSIDEPMVYLADRICQALNWLLGKALQVEAMFEWGWESGREPDTDRLREQLREQILEQIRKQMQDVAFHLQEEEEGEDVTPKPSEECRGEVELPPDTTEEEMPTDQQEGTSLRRPEISPMRL